MNHLGKLNHGNFQSIGLGALSNNINTEISGSVEAANTIIGDMSQQRKDMLISLENIGDNLLGTKNKETGERNYDGLIGRAYKNEAIALSKENQEKELTKQRINLIQKQEDLMREGKMFNDILGSKIDISNTYKDDKSKALLGNPYNVEKETITRFLMANTGLDLETAIHSWNNGGRNSQTFQSLKAAGLDENTINQAMSRANTIFNLDKEAKNIENGVIPKDILPKVAYETNKNLLGRGYTQEQAARLTEVGIQNSLTNIYQASADAEKQANSIRLQPNYLSRDAIALQEQMKEQRRVNNNMIQAARQSTNNQQQPIDNEENNDVVQDNPSTYKIARVQTRDNGSGIISYDKGNGIIEQVDVKDISKLKAYDKDGNIIKLNKNESYIIGDGKSGIESAELDGDASISSYNKGGGDRDEKAIRETFTKMYNLENEYNKIKGDVRKQARKKEIKSELKELAKEANRALGGGYLKENGELDVYRLNKEATQLLGNEGWLDTGISIVGEGINRIFNPSQNERTYEIYSKYGGVVDAGNFVFDQNFVTNKAIIGKEQMTWNQLNGNTQLDKMNNSKNAKNTNQNKSYTINDVFNPNSKGYFNIVEAAKNGDTEAKTLLERKEVSTMITESINPEAKKFITDDQKMIKDCDIDAEHLNQDSKYQAISALALLSSTNSQLKTDKSLTNKLTKALYNFFELERQGKSDGNWSKVLGDLKMDLNPKQLANIGINVTSIEDIAKMFSRKEIRDILSSPNINANVLNFILYNN